jgi:signal transduction histidine kinase/ActR/RegA family two-component response regulator
MAEREPPISDNERLRQANDALRQRIERQVGVGGGAEHAARAADAIEAMARSRRFVEAALDAAGSALMLFSDDGRLIAFNSRLATTFPDVAVRLRVGLRHEDAIRLLSAAAALDLPDAASRDAWARARIAARGAGVAPAAAPLADGRWMEFSERRAGPGAFALAIDDVTIHVAARMRARGRPRHGLALARDAIDQLPTGLAAFDADGALVLWNEPFRLLLGLGLDEVREGMVFAQLAARLTQELGAARGGPGRRVAVWIGSAPPRGPLSLDVTAPAGAQLKVQCRETAEGGFAVTVADVTAERRAAEEVARVQSTLEARVTERTGALVELNDRLVQEVAERRMIETEMRHARDAAEAANLSKTRFLAAASHDLLQPLNAAKLFLSALAASDLPPAASDMVSKVDSAFASVESLLGALLDISKLDAGGGEAQVGEFPVRQVLGPIAAEFGPLAAARGLKLKVCDSAAMVRSDPQYLRRMVQNLVSNALKYTERGGVVLGARRRGRELRIEVWDSGVGVPAPERRRIFEEFHRVEAGNPRGERGMGLGLTIVDRAARLLRHGVDVRSVEGAGSVFTIVAPAAPGRAPVPRVAAGAPPAPAPISREAGMIALVLDDDAAVRAGAAALLERWGVDVLTAADPDEALAHLAQLGMAPDVMILDYHLGGGVSGLEALATLRSAGAAGVPAVIATADRSRAVAEAVTAAGAHLLPKPVAPARLRALLNWSRMQAAE